MANQDITRKRDFSQKKTRSVASARVTHEMVDGTDFMELFNLPPNSVVVDAMMVTEVSGQAGLTVDLGDTDNEDEYLDEVTADESANHVHSMDMDIAALTLKEGTPNTLTSGTVTKSPRVATGTGATIGASFSAEPTAGQWVFIVEFIEFDLTNGQIMNLGDGDS